MQVVYRSLAEAIDEQKQVTKEHCTAILYPQTEKRPSKRYLPFYVALSTTQYDLE